ncbi:MAG: hypothetical protein AB8B55_05835 [Mariniblastus sp.]
MKTHLGILIVLVGCSFCSNGLAQEKNQEQALGKENTRLGITENPNVFDTVPNNFWAAVITPKIDRLGPKLQKLSQQAYPNQADIPSSEVDYFYEQAGFDLKVSKFNRVLDRERAGGFYFNSLTFTSVSVLPVNVKNLELLSVYLKVDQSRLENGEILKTAQKKFVKYINGNLYVCDRDSLLSSDIESNGRGGLSKDIRSFRGRISEPHQNQLKNSDVVVLLDGELYRGLKAWIPYIAPPEILTKTDSDKGLNGLLKHMDRALDFVTIGVNLDDGIQVKQNFRFREKHREQTQTLIQSIRGGNENSNLDGLPAFQFVAAFAAKGKGEQNVAVAKSILSMITSRVSPHDKIMSADDKIKFYDSFTKLWKKMNGTKVGLYRLEEPTKPDEYAAWAKKRTGRLSMVAIFDIEDPDAFLGELPALVQFANESAQRNTEIKEIMPIGFSYKKSVSKIAGHRVDELIIDTKRLSKEARWRFIYLFGNEARRIKLVPLKKQLLLYAGTSTKRLEETISNLKSGNKGLSEHPLIISSNEKIDPNKKVEFHFSASNLYEIYNYKDHISKFMPIENTSALSLTIDGDRLGTDIWFPAKEIDRSVDWMSSVFLF